MYAEWAKNDCSQACCLDQPGVSVSMHLFFFFLFFFSKTPPLRNSLAFLAIDSVIHRTMRRCHTMPASYSTLRGGKLYILLLRWEHDNRLQCPWALQKQSSKFPSSLSTAYPKATLRVGRCFVIPSPVFWQTGMRTMLESGKHSWSSVADRKDFF